ncbi:conserved hypothetical protein [Planktothrix sp. PCC 11201]|nr:conserved hypothetical protein [Planktothrix sp. PCC 11201]
MIFYKPNSILKNRMSQQNIKDTIELLQLHYDFYLQIKPYADKYEQPHPTDTRAWSQIVVSALTGIQGLGRKKGSDFIDGSDVKAANCWDAIDTPRFNGCVKAGTKASSINSLNIQPYLFFVMWDMVENTSQKRCRIWVVRTPNDTEFRAIAKKWYEQRESGQITSSNFQLHPPRNRDSNEFTNNCGNLKYPLFFEARISSGKYVVNSFDPDVLNEGLCSR